MSLVTVSQKRNRLYRRKFDHEEAVARHAAGETPSELAHAFGVSLEAVKRAVDPKFKAQHDATRDRIQRSGTCADCGGQCSRVAEFCVPCRSIRRVTTVRPTELSCSGCKSWKPDDGFPRNRAEKHRRGRHCLCTSCQTKAKRDYRRRNPGAS